MIYSPTRAKDEKWRLSLIDQMLDALNNNCPKTAKELGGMTKFLDEKIRTYDYSKADEWHYKEVRAGIS